MENKTSNFIRNETLKIEKRLFFGKIISIVIGYVGITFWLNAVRATWPIWLVWVLIIVQLILYFSIFISCYNRTSAIGFNKTLGFIIIVALAVLGRVNDWELLIIPLLVIIVLIFPTKNKLKLDTQGQTLETFIADQEARLGRPLTETEQLVAMQSFKK
jgi:hypothetical protein